jgi:hypothetical protein
MSAIGTMIGQFIQDGTALQMLTLFVIIIICVRYIYDKNKDTYVYISLTFLYLFSLMVLLTPGHGFPMPYVYAMIIPVILNMVGMMLAFKASDTQSANDDIDTMKSLVITCFVMIVLIIILGKIDAYPKILYFILAMLYILSAFVVYYANLSNTKTKRATG